MTQAILDELAKFKETPDGIALELRLSLSQIVLRHVKRRNLGLVALADKTGLKVPFLSNILHGNANASITTVATILHALGTRARFAEELE